MRMLHEFMKYFGSVVMGRQDPLDAFIEPLSMGERYLRWGLETRDLRDFRAAMDYLRQCRDRDAPMASLLMRKYSCIGEVADAAIDTLLLRHGRIIEDAVKTENGYREDIEHISRKIAEGRDYIRKLQEEGSLIKAQSEAERIEGMEDGVRHLQAMLESGEGRTEIYASYDEITADSARFFRELDQASSLVMANDILPGRDAEALAETLRTKLDYLQTRLERVDPVAGNEAAVKTEGS